MTSFRLFAVLSLFSFIDTCTEADRRPATANPPECTEFRKHRTVTGLIRVEHSMLTFNSRFMLGSSGLMILYCNFNPNSELRVT